MSAQLVSEKAYHEEEHQKGEKNKGEVHILKEAVRNLEKVIEDKKKEGEEIYN